MCMACQMISEADMQYLAKLAAEAQAKADAAADQSTAETKPVESPAPVSR